MSRPSRKLNNPKPPAKPPAKPGLWRFRLAAVVIVPLVFLVLLELILRVAGFGYPSGFLLASTNHGEKTFIQNNRFGWRFFGPRAARLPEAISIPQVKPSGTVRIFVFGESAAYGDPQPAFGLPRVLQTLLELRHPERKFEVVNAAMTAINSHVILPLALDCRKAQADAWVIYMGNNEVVGPFGAGTVFGGQTTPLSLIRFGLALKATRSGQLLDALRSAVSRGGPDAGEWEGMRMFVDNKVAAANRRLPDVYEKFARNLEDIISAGRRSGAQVVLSTVAVNLRDCAPFASLHGTDPNAAASVEWQQFFEAGQKAQNAGNFREAADAYDRAEKLDDTYAELRFRRGQSALALRDGARALAEFTAARDLDALRFRCDTPLNEIIRQQAKTGVKLAESEAAVAKASPDGIAGSESFYEHVHLTFQGNYVIGRAIAEQVESALALAGTGPWPSLDDCARRLGRTDRDTQLALTDILGRLSDSPFTAQANHQERMVFLTDWARKLPSAGSPTALGQAQNAVETAVAQHPGDAVLWEQLGEIKQAKGDWAGGVTAAQQALQLVPTSSATWLDCGLMLAQEKKYDEAAAAFQQVFALDPQAVWGRQNLALCMDKMGHPQQAVEELKHALAIKPGYGTAWLTLGQVYEEMGQTNEAQRCFQSALTNRVNRSDDLAALARFCASRHLLGDAVTNFAAAIALSPSDPGLRMESGRVLSAVGRHDEAVQQYQVAADLAPDQAQPHMQIGVELGRMHKAAPAELEFRRALQLDPNSNEARFNLGIALKAEEKLPAALEVFEEAQQRNPGDPNLRRYVEQLRNQLAPPK